MYTIGIDPGVSGALVLLDHHKKIITLIDMPVEITSKGKGKGKGKQRVDCLALGDWLRECGGLAIADEDEITVVIEKVGAMPKQGVTSMFNFGDSLGCLRGAVGALGLPVEFIRPQQWKKQMGCSHQHKDYARTLARQMYPDAELHLKKHGGRADAILIGRCGR